MLACARIGAIHSVVYAGLGHTALRDRITDAEAKVVIVGDVGFRRGKTVALKAIVDEAVDGLECVEKVVVFSRSATEICGPREIDFNALLKFSPHCPAEEMDAEDSLFLLYTSGSTGKPKGVVHVHGGYMVGTTYHLANYYDVGDRDIFWCTSDIGWVVGHSYIVYAPLCAGVTTLFREGAIDYPNPGIAWEIVERYAVTKMFTAPTALRMFMRHGETYPAAHDLTSLRVIACAGEPLNPEAWRWAQTHLAGDGKWGYVIDNWAHAWHPADNGDAPRESRRCAARCRSRCLGRKRQVSSRRSRRTPGAEAALPPHAAHGMARSGALRTRLAGHPRLLRNWRCRNQR